MNFQSLVKLVASTVWPSLRFASFSYSQEGEDIVLKRLFDGIGIRNGVYVDVGSHHPFRFSNTYLFYTRGWSGLCVDPLPGSLSQFRKSRPRDVAVEVGVAAERGEITYHMFNEPALNTFDASQARYLQSETPYRETEQRRVSVAPLRDLVREFLPLGVHVELLSIDAEGMDLEVLNSIDWKLMTPTAIVVECMGKTLESVLTGPVYALLSGLKYQIYAKTGNSVVFLKSARFEPSNSAAAC